MATDRPARHELVGVLAALPLIAAAGRIEGASAQTGGSPVNVDTKGLVAKIKFEAPLAGFLGEINGKYKLRVTELTLAPGGHVGEHNHGSWNPTGDLRLHDVCAARQDSRLWTG